MTLEEENIPQHECFEILGKRNKIPKRCMELSSVIQFQGHRSYFTAALVTSISMYDKNQTVLSLV